MSTLVGTGTLDSGGDGGKATAALISRPYGIWGTTSGIIYVGDFNYNIIRKIDTQSIITTPFFTGAGTSTGNGGMASSATVNQPYGVWGNSVGVLYVCDNLGYRLRSIDLSTSVVTSAVGSGVKGSAGDSGKATAALVSDLKGVYGNTIGYLYITDGTLHTVRQVDAAGIITVVCGSGVATYNGESLPATSTNLNIPYSIWVAVSVFYIAESGGNRVRKVSGGIVTTYAGNGDTTFVGDGGPATQAGINNAGGVAIDASGNVFVAAVGGHRLHQISTNFLCYSVAGTGNFGAALTDGPATATQIYFPKSNWIDSMGVMYVPNDGSVRMLINISPTIMPSIKPTSPTVVPSFFPTVVQTLLPTQVPSVVPTVTPVVWPYYQTLEAGSGAAGAGAEGIAATSSAISSPNQVFYSSYSGINGLLIAAYDISSIRKVSPNGIVTIFAGASSPTSYSDGVAATAVYIGYPNGVCVDSTGAVIVSFYANPRVIKFSPSGYLSSLVAGTGSNSASSTALNGDNGPATSATINTPYYVHVDSSNNVYIADYGNNKVRAVTSSGIITTVAGTGVGTASGVSGPATQTSLYGPMGVYADSSGKLYIAEYTGNYIKVLSSGSISVRVGVGTSGFVSGTASSASVFHPKGIFGDTVGNIVFSDNGNRVVRVVTPVGIVSTIGGSGSPVTSLIVSGMATSVDLGSPSGVHVDTTGNIHVSDASTSSGGSNVRRFVSLAPTTSPTLIPTSSPSQCPTTLTPTVCPSLLPSAVPSVASVIGPYLQTLVAGTGVSGVGDEGVAATSTPLTSPNQVFYSSYSGINGLLIVDYGSKRIRKTSSAGIISTFAGTSSPTSYSNGIAATSTFFDSPTGVCVDASGAVIVSAYIANRVFKFPSSDYLSSVLAGTGVSSGSSTTANGDNGAATSASLNAPWFVYADSNLNTYVSDSGNNKVRMISASGIITTVAGTGNAITSGVSGPATQATLNSLAGLYCDSIGRLYIGEYTGQYVKVVTSGIISVLAGTGSIGYSNGPLSSAQFNYPTGVAGDTLGNIFIADNVGHYARAAGTDGIVRTIMGTGSDVSGLVLSGAATSTAVGYPNGVHLDSTGCIYVSDGSTASGGSNVRKLVSLAPTISPSVCPSVIPSQNPSCCPSVIPSLVPSIIPSLQPSTSRPSILPTPIPSFIPTAVPSSVSVIGPYLQMLEAGRGSQGNGADGIAATSSSLDRPNQVFYSTYSGITGLLIAEYGNKRVRLVSSSGIMSTIAGSLSASSYSNGVAASSTYIDSPTGVCVDASGALIVTTSSTHRVLKFSSSGYLSSVFAGTGTISSAPTALNGDDGPATSATFNYAFLVYVDTSLNVYVSDVNNNKVRAISASGIITTVAGSGSAVISGASGPATQASVYSPGGVFCDSVGRLYVGETSGQYVKVVSSGIISVLAGTGISGYANGPASSAQFSNPEGIFGDSSGNIFMADYSTRYVRVAAADATVRTIMGTGSDVSGLISSGMATSTSIGYPVGICVDSTGYIHVSDISTSTGGSSVKKLLSMAPTVIPSIGPTMQPTILPSSSLPSVLPTLTPSLCPSLIPTQTPSAGPSVVIGPYLQTLEAGTGTQGAGADGVTATSSALTFPNQVYHTSYSGINGLLIADFGTLKVRKVDTSGIVSTFAGSASPTSFSSGVAATSTYIDSPTGVCVDVAGSVYVSTYQTNRVLKFAPNGYVSSVLAGTGTASVTSAALNGDNGPATSATFNYPYFVHVDTNLNVYIADSNNYRVRVVSASGIVTTVAGIGNGVTSGASGPATQATLNTLAGVYCDSIGRVYIGEYFGQYVKVVTSGIISVLTGTGTSGYSNGPASSAQLSNPFGVYGDTIGIHC